MIAGVRNAAMSLIAVYSDNIEASGRPDARRKSSRRTATNAN